MAASLPVVVGFVGLGSMGAPMARNLCVSLGRGALAPYRAVLHDARAGAAEAAAANYSATNRFVVAASLASLANRSNVVLLSVPDGAAMRSVVKSMRPHLTPGAVVVDLSTTSPQDAREAASDLADIGVGFLDAPVTGAPHRAASADLTVMVGGDAARAGELEPLLSTFASKVLHMGAVGNGQLAKAMNNCLYNVSCAAMAEMLPLAQRAGLPLGPFVEAVSSGSGQSFGFDHWAPRVLAREFEAPEYGYPMQSAYKDLETVSGLADELSVNKPPVLAAARCTYERALEMGLGGQHKGAMARVFERELGVECAEK